MSRAARHTRVTRETEVTVAVDLDGSGAANIDTGIGFFDHLLTALACHSLIDLSISTRGDLEVDDHHSVEDTCLALGTAIAEALGDRTGICRFGAASVPMDESLATAAVDAGGRPYAVVELSFRGASIGALSTQMIPHAIEALARNGGLTLHVSGSGWNDHHLAEAAFKALARALRAAVEADPRRSGIPSTKGAV